MTDSRIIALSGTPCVGKSSLAEVMAQRGWNLLSLRDLAEEHGFLGEEDTHDGAAPVDIHALDEAWEQPTHGNHIVDGHLAHLLQVDAIVLLRCRPSILRQRLEARGYTPEKVRANAEWEMTAGHWSELIEFEIDLPVLEMDSSETDANALAGDLETWLDKNCPFDGMENAASGALDWLAQSGD